jgi:hypothetical protein
LQCFLRYQVELDVVEPDRVAPDDEDDDDDDGVAAAVDGAGAPEGFEDPDDSDDPDPAPEDPGALELDFVPRESLR